MDENFNINPDIVDREATTTRDPFADEWGGPPFVDEVSKLNLNKLLHLVPYSEVLLVSGPLGVGKSTLLRQFVVSAKKNWKAVHLHGSSLLTMEEFLRQVVHGFGLPTAGVDHLEDMLVEIGRYLRALARSGRRAIVVIDDAHLLNDDVIVMVEHILSDEHSANAVSLVLGVGDGAAIERLNNFPVLLHKLAYTLHLAPMAEADVAGYLHHRLAHAGGLAVETRFDEARIKQLYNKSGGLPGKLNELARRQLNKKAPTGNGRHWLRWGLALAGVAVIGAVLLFQDRINQWVGSKPHVPHVLPQGSEQAAKPVAPAIEGVAEEPLEAAAAVAVPAQSMGELADPSADQASVAAQAETTPVMAESLSDVASVATPEAVESPVTNLAVVPKSTSTKAVIEPARSSPPIESAPKTLNERAKDEAKGWLQSQNPQHFTLQLMALADEPDVRQFARRHKLQGQSEIFPITRKGSQLAVLVYGSYPDRAAADEAAKVLPKAWRIKDPWVRSFASVFKDIDSN